MTTIGWWKKNKQVVNFIVKCKFRAVKVLHHAATSLAACKFVNKLLCCVQVCVLGGNLYALTSYTTPSHTHKHTPLLSGQYASICFHAHTSPELWEMHTITLQLLVYRLLTSRTYKCTESKHTTIDKYSNCWIVTWVKTLAWKTTLNNASTELIVC